MIYQNRQNGFTPIVIVLLVIVGIGAIGGAVYFMKNKGTQDEKSQQEILGSEERAEQRRGFRADNFLAGTAEDLTIGEKITVRGTENQDGSVTATMIFVGTLDFSNRPMPEGFERMQRMQEFRANAGGNFRAGGGRMMAGGAAFIRGEVIDKDEMSITVKLVDSGSKLIFYSDDTEIRKVDKNNDSD